MGRIVSRVRALALAWGAPGLFGIAFLDSSVLPLPGVTDLMLILMVTRHPALMPLFVGAALAGSLAGCLLMYGIGKIGGEAFVRQRFSGSRIERAMASLRRHGMMAVLIPSLLPPPSPFKIFVLLAGVVGISASRFTAAIGIGRGIRYLGLGLLAVRYGARASTYVAEHGLAFSIVLAGVVGAGFAGYLGWSKARNRKNR
jgi:membrane protein YqaA with SNARE-associated domain